MPRTSPRTGTAERRAARVPDIAVRLRELVEVAPGVHVTTAATFTTTSTLVVDDGACLLVDPALTPEDLLALAATIEARGWRVAAAFATHPHWDHMLWLPALGDAHRTATAAAARWAAGHAAEVRAQAEHDAPGHRWATIGGLTALPEGALTVPWPGSPARVVEHGAHAPGSAALHLATARVLVAGDVLSDLEVPFLDADAVDPVGSYLHGLDTIEAVLDGGAVDVVVPGHGHVADLPEARRRLAADRRYLEALAAGGAAAGDDDPRLADRAVRAEHVAQRDRLRVARR